MSGMISTFDPLLSVITSLNTHKTNSSSNASASRAKKNRAHTPPTSTAASSKRQPKKPAHLAPSSNAPPCTWTKEESHALQVAVNVHKSKNWVKIVDAVGGEKTQEQCMAHWRNVLNPPVVKGKGSWTPEEDEALQNLVEQHGRTKWSFIGRFLPGRVGKQCRERWHNHLNPELKKVAWSEEEEQLIVRVRAELGNRWAKIARMLPGRSDNDVKNRWYASLRKRVDEDGDPSVLLPKKKRAKDQKKKKAGTKRKRKKKQPLSAAGTVSPFSSSSSSLLSSSSSSFVGSPLNAMSAMFDKHLPLNKRARMDSGTFTTLSGKSTPIRPQKSEGASMLLGMAAFLANQNNAGAAEASTVTSNTAASTDDVRNGVNVSTKSGAKMLADAEFLVSLGGPVSLSTGTVSSPGGLRVLVASSATN